MKYDEWQRSARVPVLVLSLLMTPCLASADAPPAEQEPAGGGRSIDEVRAAATGGWRLHEDIGLLRARMEAMHRHIEMQRQELLRAGQELDAMRQEVAELRAAERAWAEESQALQQRTAVQVDAPIIRRRASIDPPEIVMLDLEPAEEPAPVIDPEPAEDRVVVEPERPTGGEMAVVEDVPAETPPAEAPERDAEDRPADSPGDDVEALALQGEVLMQERDLAGAERLFIAVIELEPDHMGARVGLATVYYLRGELVQALRAFDSLAREAPAHEEVLGMLGLIAWQQGRLQDATDILRQALDHFPLSGRLHNYLGVVWHAQGEYDRAEHEFLRAVELDNELEEAFFNLAVLLCLPQKASVDEARLFYERALQLGRDRHPQLERILYGN